MGEEIVQPPPDNVLAWTFFEASLELLAVGDSNGRVLRMNPAFRRFVGIALGAERGRTVADWIHPDDAKALPEHVMRAREVGPVERKLWRLRTADGSYRWTEWSTLYDPQLESYYCCGRDVNETIEARYREHLLLQELDHRVKNTLASVQALAELSAATTTPDRFIEVFRGRLRALAAAHELLAGSAWMGVDMHRLIERVLAPYATAQRLIVEGEPVLLAPRVAQGLGMAFHELGTNAVKHGAWASGAGMVRLRWAPRAASLDVEWQEQSERPVQAPTTSGFGVDFLERGIRHELRADTRIEFRPQGLTWFASIPDAAPGTRHGPLGETSWTDSLPRA